jgi:uncharacterized protein (DUF2249 family)
MQTLESIDLRGLALEAGSAKTLEAFAALPPEQSLEVTGDQDPLTLRQQLQAQWPGQFGWQTLTVGDTHWTVRVTRKPAGKSCCGCCGG